MNMNAPLSTPTSSGGRSCVVGGDLLAELGDALLEIVGARRRDPLLVHRHARLARDVDRQVRRRPRSPLHHGRTLARMQPHSPPLRSTRRPPASSVARISPRATASTRSTSASDGGGAPSH